MTSSQIPPQNADQENERSHLHRLAFLSNRSLRSKLIVSFVFIAVLGTILTYLGMRIAFTQITTDALPSLQALSAMNTLTRAVQVEALSFISTGNLEDLDELDENIEQLNQAIDHLLALSDDEDEIIVFSECAASAQQIARLSQDVVQSHQYTLETITTFEQQGADAEAAFLTLSDEIDAKIEENVKNEDFETLRTVTIPTKVFLDEFFRGTKDFLPSALGYVADGDPESIEAFNTAEDNLETAQENLANVLGTSEEGAELIENLNTLEENLETTGREVLSSHGNTLALLDDLEDAETDFQTKVDTAAEKVNRDINWGLFLTRLVTAVTALVVAAISIGFGLIVTRTIVRPVTRLMNATRRMETGDLSTYVPVKSGDEIGLLAQSFNNMTAYLRRTLNDLQKQTRALKTSAEISRRLSTILERDRLLSAVVDQLQSAFGYYHVHIYLFDDTRQNLVMTSGAGEPGRIMWERGHTIPLGKGLVGRAAATNQGILASDTSQEPDWLPNELLPETRAEAALPIAIGNTVLGVLDVQENTVGGLTEDDQELLQAIASQVAIAVQNAQSYEQARRQAEHESRITTISQRIRAATTIDEVLQITITELGQIFGAQQAAAELQIDKKNGVDTRPRRNE